MLGAHHQVSSPVHRMPAGVKLAVLCLTGTAAFFVHSLLVLAGGVVVVAGVYAVARIPPRLAWWHTAVVVPFAVPLLAAQWWLAGGFAAAVVVLRLVGLVALANLVTLTTSTSAMLAAFEAALRPARVLGVRPERVGLVVAMTVRFIPVLRARAERVREARRARGAGRGLSLTPLLVSTLRMADGLGEALEARGAGDAPRERRRCR